MLHAWQRLVSMKSIEVECGADLLVPVSPRCEGLSIADQTNAVAARLRSKGLQSGLFFLLNIKDFVQLGDLKDFVNLRIDVAEYQSTLRVLQLLIQGDELSERGAGKIFDVAEVEKDLVATA